MFTQSGALALLGMAVVFMFLIIMIVVISLAGRVIHALGVTNGGLAAVPAGAAASCGVDDAVAAAITAAVRSYRNEHPPL
jgi:oxaloacetate decarboxylase gamma subunit